MWTSSSWNATEMTRECVGSLLRSDYTNFRVLLVDNGSDEPCGERVWPHGITVALTFTRQRGLYPIQKLGGLQEGLHREAHRVCVGSTSQHFIKKATEKIRFVVGQRPSERAPLEHQLAELAIQCRRSICA